MSSFGRRMAVYPGLAVPTLLPGAAHVPTAGAGRPLASVVLSNAQVAGYALMGSVIWTNFAIRGGVFRRVVAPAWIAVAAIQARVVYQRWRQARPIESCGDGGST